MAGVYVHFPFCGARCIYCDFYARVRRDWTPYVGALLRELSARKTFLQGVPPTTLYFGGGTPSLLPPELLARVAEAVRTTLGVPAFEEFTLEANPDDVTVERAAAWRAAGATRISIGIQSFDDAHLRWMRRRHTAAQAAGAVATLRAAGFDNLSLDLIFGFSGLADETWRHSVEAALALRPEHLSCYQMTGRWADGDEERCRRQYEWLRLRLTDAGYRQYEVSNFALPGFESRHNAAYWRRAPYLGLGAAAHSFDGDRFRCWNTPDIDAYIAARPGGGERLSEREAYEEKLMLGLRTVAGLLRADLTARERRWLDEKKPVLERLSKTGRLLVDADSVRIPAGELFVSDAIVRELFPDADQQQQQQPFALQKA